MEGYIIISISGENSDINGDWYAPANQVQYINDELVNFSSSSINLYKTPSQNYPRISLPSNQYPIYYASGYNNYYSFDVQPDQVRFNLNAQMYRLNPYFDLIICTLLFFLVFSRIVRRTKSW